MKALITGITGQDGSYLAELLLEKGYDVYGMVRRSSTESFERIEHIKDKITLAHGDLLDQLSILRLVEEVHPDEIYNLGAQSFVPTSWTQPKGSLRKGLLPGMARIFMGNEHQAVKLTICMP